MIASFTNGWIFVKTRKTGGTSVEIVLSGWCREPDVCTPVLPDDEIIRARFGGLAPVTRHNGRPLYNHMPASEISAAFPRLWQRAFKFTIERHPYEKAVSRAYWNLGSRGADAATEFDRELAQVIETSSFIDRELYIIDGALAVDEVILHDRLWERIGAIGREAGKSLPDPLPMAKGHFRLEKRPASEILTAAQKSAIQQAAAFEFSTFGFLP